MDPWLPGPPASVQSQTPRLSLWSKDDFSAIILLALCLWVGIGAMSASAFAASSDMAVKDLELQARVAKAKLAQGVIDGLGDDYAGVWFEPAAAKFHIGVISAASSRIVRQLAGQAGLAAAVVVTPVRSTWAELIAAQDEWNRRLAPMLVSDEATTGIEPEHNAISVILSSSVSAPERATLIDEAANARVNVLIKVEPTSKLGWARAAKKTCEAPFTIGSAFCEEAITAGVGIGVESTVPICTAGPELIEGNETWMLTAGHCFGGETGGEGFLNTKVTSAYPAGTLKLVGKTGTRYYNKKRDMSEVRVLSAAEGGFFAEALPTPVPALVTEWVKSPKTPQAVEGLEEAMRGQKVCKEGMITAEKCGEVLEVNVLTSAEHTFVISACGKEGDSGGPVYTEETYLMLGISIAAKKECPEAGAKMAVEPLKGFPGAVEFGILGTFTGQSLLTKANETRPSLAILPAKATFTVKSTAGENMRLETLGGKKIECRKDTGSGEVVSGRLGSLELKWTECEEPTLKTKCTGLGDTFGNITVKAEFHLRHLLPASEGVDLLALVGHVHFTCLGVLFLMLGCVASGDILDKSGGVSVVNKLLSSLFLNILQEKGDGKVVSVDTDNGLGMENCELKIAEGTSGTYESAGQLGSGTIETCKSAGVECTFLIDLTGTP